MTLPERLGPFTVIGTLDDDAEVLLGLQGDAGEVLELRRLKPGERVAAPAVLPSLKHSSLCVVRHVEVQATPAFVAREHLAGCRLDRLVERLRQDRQALPEGIAGFVTSEVLDALDFLHRQRDPITRAPMGLGHGALRLSNILITHDGGVKLLDFGLHPARAQQDLNQAAGVLGRLFETPPRALVRAHQSETAFETCGALADAVREGKGQGERHERRALQALMQRLFPDAAADQERRLADLMNRRRESEKRELKATPRAATKAPPVAPGATKPAARDAGEPKAPVAEAPRLGENTKRALIGLGSVVGAVVFVVWGYYIVQWFQDAGMLPTSQQGRVLEDGPALGGRMIEATSGARRGKTPRRRGPRAPPNRESTMGAAAGTPSTEERGVLDGCSHPCANAVTAAVASGGKVMLRDDEVELSSTNLQTCLSLCRDTGGAGR